uniref:DNA-directed DNA polymerase n=1 Tax=Ditylenchus dipsaci TaxID=166011 RepID=A0A915DIW6_9BILA
MELIENTKGCRVLYTDTDSVIYEHPVEANPLEMGEFLGQMTAEYSDSDIILWACTGPKQYAMELRTKNSEELLDWHVIKVRGLTLDERNGRSYSSTNF